METSQHQRKLPNPSRFYGPPKQAPPKDTTGDFPIVYEVRYVDIKKIV